MVTCQLGQQPPGLLLVTRLSVEQHQHGDMPGMLRRVMGQIVVVGSDSHGEGFLEASGPCPRQGEQRVAPETVRNELVGGLGMQLSLGIGVPIRVRERARTEFER